MKLHPSEMEDGRHALDPHDPATWESDRLYEAWCDEQEAARECQVLLDRAMRDEED